MTGVFFPIESTIEELLHGLEGNPYYEYFTAVGNGMSRVALCDALPDSLLPLPLLPHQLKSSNTLNPAA